MNDKKSFEDKLKELETIISALENGEFGLDESIEQYTKAMKLINECDLELKNVEERISKVVKDNVEEDFKIEQD